MMKIGNREIGPGNPAFLIAEAGFNHNGSFEIALDLVDAAADAGADAIKFQSFTPDTLLHPSVSYRHLFEEAQLSRDAHAELAERAAQRGILFASTPFDEEWVRFLDQLNVAFLKVASMDLTTPPLLKAIAKTGRPVILSTGLATLEEVGTALALLKSGGANDVALLHCVSLYPTPLASVNLRAIETLRKNFHVPVGFSDHTLGIEIPIWAVAAGTCVIEKHFTTDCSLPGGDHAHSLDPEGFRNLVQGVRAFETALGSGIKQPDDLEKRLIAGTRRGLSLTKDLRKGDALRPGDLIALRPIPESDGIPAAALDKVMDTKARRDLPAGTLLRWSDVL